jgi:hypothetical protein
MRFLNGSGTGWHRNGGDHLIFRLKIDCNSKLAKKAQLGVTGYLLLEYDDPMKLLAGKPESRKAGMLREHGTFELPSFPASELQAY